MSDRPQRLVTRSIILLSAAIWACWDVVVFLWKGSPATISAEFGRWFALPVWGWVLVGGFGYLIGHLLGMMPAETPALGWRVAVALGMAAVGLLITLRG